MSSLPWVVTLALAAWADPIAETGTVPTKEPVYVSSSPRYAKVVLGPKHTAEIWLVLDQSTPEGTAYDVLYADLDGDGDLTESEERFTATSQGTGSQRFELGSYKDGALDCEHTEFTVRTEPTGKLDMVSLRWRGGKRMSGGYPADPAGGYMQFAASVKEAPVVWFNGDGPFEFQRWFVNPLKIDGATDVKLFLGRKGRGPNSFAAWSEHVLPEGMGVRATLVYRDADGQEKSELSELLERC
jgi:hypothetical protein